MRRVLYIPAWHNYAERGGKGPYEAYLQMKDLPQNARDIILEEHVRFFNGAEQYWSVVRKLVSSLIDDGDIDPEKSRLYSDSMTSPLEETLPLLMEMGYEGSHHALLMLDFLNLGAKYEITESDDIISNGVANDIVLKRTKERHWRRQALPDSEEKQQLLEENKSLMVTLSQRQDEIVQQRDKEIANRIDRTLQVGEIGILIMGADHRVSHHLAQDLVFEPLHERLVEATAGDSGKREVRMHQETEQLHSRSPERG